MVFSHSRKRCGKGASYASTTRPTAGQKVKEFLWSKGRLMHRGHNHAKGPAKGRIRVMIANLRCATSTSSIDNRTQILYPPADDCQPCSKMARALRLCTVPTCVPDPCSGQRPGRRKLESLCPPSAEPSTNRRTRAAHVRWYGRPMALYHDRHGSLLPRCLAKDTAHTDPRRVLARAHPR